MAYAGNSFFFGEIDGATLKDLGKLDVSKTSLEDRKKCLSDQLDSTNYFVDYLSQFYKVNINSNEALSEDVDIFKRLEQMATYLLKSDESKAIDQTEKKVYVFHNRRERFSNYMNRESVSMNQNGKSINIVDSDNIVHALMAKKKNSRKPKIQKILPQDLKRKDIVGEVLRDYQVFLDHIERKLHEEQDKNWRKYSRQRYLVQQDMIDAKNMLSGVWGFNISVSESHVPDLNIFDFTDYDTVRYLLDYPCPSVDFEEEMWIVWQDFMETVKKAGLTKEEAKIVCCLQQNWRIQEISDELGIKYASLYQTVIPRIVKKIMKVGNKYDCFDPKVEEKVKRRKINAGKIKE